MEIIFDTYRFSLCSDFHLVSRFIYCLSNDTWRVNFRVLFGKLTVCSSYGISRPHFQSRLMRIMITVTVLCRLNVKFTYGATIFKLPPDNCKVIQGIEQNKPQFSIHSVANLIYSSVDFFPSFLFLFIFPSWTES